MAKHDPVPVGQQYGEWTVLGYAKTSYWNCKCSCGDEHAVRIANLRNGTSSRCINCQRLNATPPPNKQKIFCEIGKSYGFWRVLRASDRTGYYECKCEKCGKTTKERRTTQLLNTESMANNAIPVQQLKQELNSVLIPVDLRQYVQNMGFQSTK